MRILDILKHCVWYDIDWHLQWVHDQTPWKIKILLKIIGRSNFNVELDRKVLYFAFYNLPTIIKSFLCIYMVMYCIKKHLEILLVILVIHIIYAGSGLSRQAYQHFLSHLRLRVIPCSHSTAVLRFWFFIPLLYKWRVRVKRNPWLLVRNYLCSFILLQNHKMATWFLLDT